MDALFNTLKSGRRYELHFGNQREPVEAVFHEYHPDGTMKFGGAGNMALLVNPNWIITARELVRR